ncbi:GNAT family N-acetyltransferase [Amycolatopsis cihanbeyliensis]|uniref:RimJ/RimL family protein N-acetyltransferase n=1 Tax=Amycolatopsis cihanbeyliensis TaxID=1128664 RepID=A0A542DJ68_AMYCI|nr:GNAT family N-acetyltransferase [Amycolatopsis cihanbeyliensis]TQJ03110.1 RimJ/RimL family protein N-acetyltransferase [Amycolatopsis cihanbeyliensis]
MHPADTLARHRVRLLRWRETDVDTLFHVVTESLAHLRPWMAWAAPPYDHAAAADFVTRAQERWAGGESYAYAITVSGTTVGACGLERRIGPGALEIGYWLHPAHTGHGLATEAAAALVVQAFGLPDIDRVQIWHDLANTASAGVPRRLGFTEVARRAPPRYPLAPAEVGVDVVWELTAEQNSRSGGLC